MSATDGLLNYIAGAWRRSTATERLDVMNPATAETLARTPLSPGAEVAAAAEAAALAATEWSRVPATDRIQFLFKLKALLEQNLDEISRICTNECGKTYAESKGEIQRAIENIEVACGIPSLMQGYNSEDIARGIDEHMFRQPVGVVAAITPFNFPGMIPYWFMPYALATGNCFILKPSEKTPMTSGRIFELIDTLGLRPGVVQLVNGGKETVDAILDHPAIRAISFVGSRATARYIYRRAAVNGKRAQCQGGAKNPVVIMPDADMDTATRIVADAGFGCAGQRCLALAQVITVASARRPFTERIAEAAVTRKVGYGLDDGIEMGPVIRAESKARIETLIGEAVHEGAKLLVDGRGKHVSGYEKGYFVFPTVMEDLPDASRVAHTEIFGPVLSLTHRESLDEAIRLVNDRSYGNMASIFTGSGSAARQFRQEVSAGNVGINIGVAAPMAFFPFSGWNDSFFGDLHGQGRHGVEFYTQTKVVVERWPKEWSRRF
jgi:malonate-semialdehyde dehydrogenase (acetylating)/methylmalonate-semialdehyde dehydrogenase